MSDKDAGTPRVFLIRHGETEWSRSGQYTGKTDIPLLPEGEEKVRESASLVFGAGRLVDPAKLAHVFLSPRVRAQKTWQIFLEEAARGAETTQQSPSFEVTTTEEIGEWSYGLYEGKLTHEIRAMRKEHGLDQDQPWDIWRDGCEEGESAVQVTNRLDGLIERIKAIQSPAMAKGGKGKGGPCDVVVVAHGHILRAFVKRWLRYPMEFPLSMMLEPGGVGGLSYQHKNIEEPACLVGMSFSNPATKGR